MEKSVFKVKHYHNMWDLGKGLEMEALLGWYDKHVLAVNEGFTVVYEKLEVVEVN